MKIIKSRRFKKNLTRALLSIVVASLFYLPGFTQNKKDEEKIAPAFRSLIAKEKITIPASQKKCLFKKRKPVKTLSKSGEKKYDCIVYTNNAKAIRDQGIIVNSVLPTFVTSSATLQQILQMASLPGVTYIDAPSIDTLND